MNNIEIKYMDLPGSVNGFVQLIEEPNRYLIGINTALDEEGRKRTLKHEMLHIEMDHLHCKKSAIECEAEIERILNNDYQRVFRQAQTD